MRSAQGGIEARRNASRQLCELFGRENVYVELQRHFCREEEARNQAALEIARKLRLPLLATNGVCHAQPQQREVLDVFTCIRHHRTLATAGRLLARNSERHLKSPAEMARLFSDLPEAIANTADSFLAPEIYVEGFGLPVPEISRAGRRVADAISARAHLRRHASGATARRTTSTSARASRSSANSTMIEKLDLAGYFLIVWDIVRFCRERNILVQGPRLGGQ